MPKQTKTEPSKRLRVPFNAEILMQTGDVEWSCNLLDLSLNGMLVEPPENLDINKNNPCAIALFLSNDVSIHARVKIAHSQNDFWGLNWLEIDKISLKHLRQIIQKYTNDTSLQSRQLNDLISDYNA